MEELNSNLVEEGTESKTIDAIVKELFDTRSGYIKGLRYGLKPTIKILGCGVRSKP